MENYHVLELIGEGSFGKVYKGRKKYNGQVNIDACINLFKIWYCYSFEKFYCMHAQSLWVIYHLVSCTFDISHESSWYCQYVANAYMSQLPRYFFANFQNTKTVRLQALMRV